MKTALMAGRRLLGLFVDDGSIAAALILWSAAAGYLLPALPINAGWDGPIDRVWVSKCPARSSVWVAHDGIRRSSSAKNQR